MKNLVNRKDFELNFSYLFLQLLLRWHFELHNIFAFLQEHCVVHPLVQLQRTKPCPCPLDCAFAVVRREIDFDGTSSSVMNLFLHTPNSDLQMKKTIKHWTLYLKCWFFIPFVHFIQNSSFRTDFMQTSIVNLHNDSYHVWKVVFALSMLGICTKTFSPTCSGVLILSDAFNILLSCFISPYNIYYRLNIYCVVIMRLPSYVGIATV